MGSLTILRPPGAKIMQNMSFVAARGCQELPGAARSCQERPPGAKIQEQLVAANPRSHANFQIFYSISCFWMFNWQPFSDLINSKDCTHEFQFLNFSDLKKVDKTVFSKTRFTSQKKNTFFQQNNFGPNVIYWLPYPPAAARSIQEQLWESKCWFSIGFIRKTWFRRTNCC